MLLLPELLWSLLNLCLFSTRVGQSKACHLYVFSESFLFNWIQLFSKFFNNVLADIYWNKLNVPSANFTHFMYFFQCFPVSCTKFWRLLKHVKPNGKTCTKCVRRDNKVVKIFYYRILTCINRMFLTIFSRKNLPSVYSTSWKYSTLCKFSLHFVCISIEV